MTLLKKILKRKHIIAQSVCNHPIENLNLLDTVMVKVVQMIGCIYFSRCNLWAHDTIKGWMPKEKEVIECLEVEIAPDNWIMAVDTNNTSLLFLSINYNIQWKECPCMKGVRLEDVTPELEEKALNEIKNNN
ncbi:hypothetical protein KNV37_gp52 [uncultured phage cr110_1]|uniref:Uncharacterized protein n=1 Tax=uncultured phage cr110_1 TaxID=2772070 RepID=A0A7M1S1A0_9CAUD|nr:hypothetical protein KNV37_gp52 [uncultured phage cr110_1]QOR59090.1 hypothetical protein [uncultured phage cr110_1]